MELSFHNLTTNGNICHIQNAPFLSHIIIIVIQVDHMVKWIKSQVEKHKLGPEQSVVDLDSDIQFKPLT